MQHDEVAALLLEFAAGRLAGDQAAAVREHLDSCRECQEVLRINDLVRHEVSEYGEALFSEHPTTDDLVTFAIASDEFTMARIATIDAHVRICSDCQHKVQTIRQVDEERRPRSANQVTVSAGSLLILPSPAAMTAENMPSVSLGADAASLSILILPRPDSTGEPDPTAMQRSDIYRSLPLESVSGNQQMLVSIRALRDQKEKLTHLTSVSDLIDRQSGIFRFNLPTEALEPGEYEIELINPVDKSVAYSARFAIAV